MNLALMKILDFYFLQLVLNVTLQKKQNRSKEYKTNNDTWTTTSTGIYCMKSVRIGSFSGAYFPEFGLNTERYGVFSPNPGKYEP